jgi:hypothetical protein
MWPQEQLYEYKLAFQMLFRTWTFGMIGGLKVMGTEQMDQFSFSPKSAKQRKALQLL